MGERASTPTGVAGFQLRTGFVVADDLTHMDLSVSLVREDDEIAHLHFMDESEQLSGVVRDGTGFLVRIGLCYRHLECIAGGGELGQVAHGMPPEGHAAFRKKQGGSITGLASVDAPDGGGGGDGRVHGKFVFEGYKRSINARS
jgi:hypothetical protein